MIRALICDWGGVLMRTVDPRPRMAWERRLGLPPSGLVSLFFGGSAWQRAQRGEISLQDVWAQVGSELDLSQTELAALSRDFWAGDRLDRELVTLISQLRQENLDTALLSNHPSNLPHLLSDLDLDDLLDPIIVSALEGVTKPDPEIYQRTLDRLGVEPSEAVFVDDYYENVEAARELGLTGIHFRGTPHLRRSLAAVGLPVEPPTLSAVPGIRAVIFDWGGVLSPLHFLRRSAHWEERMNLEPGTLHRVLWGTEWKQLEIGTLSREAYDEHVARGLNMASQKALDDFYQEYYAEDSLNQDLVPVIRKLRKDYHVAMLTNAFPGHAEMLEDRYEFDPRSEFDLYVNSAEVGMAKPNPAIYRLVLDRLQVAPQEAVFLDDSVRNIDAAQALGIHSLVFTDTETALADLASLLDHPVA